MIVIEPSFEFTKNWFSLLLPDSITFLDTLVLDDDLDLVEFLDETQSVRIVLPLATCSFSRARQCIALALCHDAPTPRPPAINELLPDISDSFRLWSPFYQILNSWEDGVCGSLTFLALHSSSIHREIVSRPCI